MDRRTDRQTEFSSLDRVCIPCSALKTVNIYTLMKIKLTFIIKQPQIYKTRTTLSTQKKINVTSALSRAESELHQAEVTAVVRYQTSKKGRTVA